MKSQDLINQLRERERYFAYSTPLTVIAPLATVSVQILIDADPFEIYMITGQATTPASLSLQFREQGGDNWGNLPVFWNNIAGSALQPFWLPVTRVIDPRKTLTIDFTDLLGGNVAVVTLHGGKIVS